MRHRVLLVPLAAAASLLAACTGHSQQPASRASNSVASAPAAAASVPAGAGRPNLSAASNGCAGQPPVSSLPTWARAGFTPADVAMPHVTGASGNIVAILWSPKNALHAPPLPTMFNKILWVSRVPADGPAPLVIRATLAGSTRTATVSLPDGPGPSYVDLPAPGCWTLHLSWGGHTDRLMLRYVS